MPHILLDRMHTLQLPMHHPFIGRLATMMSIWCGFILALYAILQKRPRIGTLLEKEKESLYYFTLRRESLTDHEKYEGEPQ